MQKNRYRLSLTAALLAAMSLAACTPAETEVPAPASAAETSQSAAPSAAISPAPTKDPAKEAAKAEVPAASGTALEQLATIDIKGRAPKTGYSREQFGDGWLDPDRNGCDARNDILQRDLVNETFKPGTSNCVVLTGTLADPFTATTIDFVRGNKTSTLVQIDHIVALSDGWQKGAQQLTASQREAFANDPLNLMAADGPTNGAKSDSDAATWLPPNKGFRCEYVALQTAVKAKYDLWMTQAEHDAIKNILTSSCPDQPAPADNGGVAVPVAMKEAPAKHAPAKESAAKQSAQKQQAPAAQQKQDAPAGSDEETIVYENCADVKANGAAPIKVGDLGWDQKFDRDGDGVGCES
ncbi:GmrSD restriction endonuclease domain-containing protein [Crystallibacter degradans]|uniref:GmrSD restriction endonuclease domain-containing protein n=1 Tax=Crystallibacter degradans TaxID=2726743 RepID=UPI001474C542|nr:DUF1524 domain-containing protein [Arthrobacter sp. SF27]NMR32332.1 DUF1524 domain-containing protein [Arthrobacter sp. SF27]